METADASFGSDKYGLVWGYAFEPGDSARPIDCDGAAARLNAGLVASTAGEFLWLHFSLSNAAAERWLRQNLSLPEG